MERPLTITLLENFGPNKKGNTMKLNSFAELKSFVELDNHIKQLNADADRQMAEQPGLWVSHLMPAEKWVENYGIDTVEKFEHQMLFESYSNVYKDTFGVRPRGKVTVAEMKSFLERA